MAVTIESSIHTDNMTIGAGLMAGGANVIMQLAHPSVGHGVVESKVESGQLFRHPIKRSRTTFTYLVVAAQGTPEERAEFKRWVNRQHAQVRSNSSSPVSYNAFNRDLQLWVAACLYKGVEDINTYFGPKLTAEEEAVLYREGARLGTTLQVPEDMWPSDRAAFEEYWNDALKQVSIDDTVREYLYELTMLRFLPRFISLPFGPLNRFITTGFLPRRFREEMRLPWSAAQQRRFDRLMAVLGGIVRRLPPVLRKFPFNLVMWDLRQRMKAGKPLA